MDGNGMIRLTGDSHAVRVDHCHFGDLAYEAVGIAVWGPIYGVIDHNLFDYRTKSNQSINIHMAGWGGHDNGDGSWADLRFTAAINLFLSRTTALITRTDTQGAG